MGVPVDVGQEVDVLLDVIVCVLLGDALALRVGARVRVPVRVTRILGLPVDVAVSVLERGDRLTVGLPVDVLDGGEERVREGEPVDVLVPPIDRVADRLTGPVRVPLDVLVEHGDAVFVFEEAEEIVMLGEAEFVLDPR